MTYMEYEFFKSILETIFKTLFIKIIEWYGPHIPWGRFTFHISDSDADFFLDKFLPGFGVFMMFVAWYLALLTIFITMIKFNFNVFLLCAVVTLMCFLGTFVKTTIPC